jgi:hypothetical protein
VYILYLTSRILSYVYIPMSINDDHDNYTNNVLSIPNRYERTSMRISSRRNVQRSVVQPLYKAPLGRNTSPAKHSLEYNKHICLLRFFSSVQ